MAWRAFVSRPDPFPDYGPAHPDDLDAVARLSRLGFGLPREVFDRYAALFGTDTIRRLRLPGSSAGIAACAAHWTMDQWFGGRPVPVQAIAMVAVDPALRGSGHGSMMMRSLLMEARQSGAALSVLWPATLPFYNRLGYGRGGVLCQWSAPPAALDLPAERSTAAMFRMADPLDAVPLAALRRPVLAEGNGLPERTEALWTLALCPEGEPAELYRNDSGYIAVLPPRDQRLTVADACLPSGSSLRAGMRLLAGFRAQVDRVAWCGGPDDPIALLAGDGITLDKREEWLARPLDVTRALEARGYPAGVETSAEFRLVDPLIPENSGHYRLEVAQSAGKIFRDAQGSGPAAEIGIGAFASLFTGHASARTLWRAGLLRGDETMICRLQGLFCGGAAWMPDRF
ncbi:GNAT family N-acetyltransferase [Azospirillum picis]|uniref:GNAT family N-acetyltransferase n=1 Tax=Azospirillum picis TaxID=488438 RepID=UPI0031B8585B